MASPSTTAVRLGKFAIGCALTLCSGIAFYSELAAGSYVSQSSPKSFLTSDISTIPIGHSTLSQGRLLDKCLEALTSIDVRLMAESNRQRVGQTCAALADAITSLQPSNGYAWLVRAWGHAVSGDTAAFGRDLFLSQKVTPNEQWIAELRVRAIGDFKGPDSPETAHIESEDLALLVRSQRGVASIAARYINDPRFRERVVRVLEGAPSADQRRFIDAVRAAAARMGIVIG